MKVNLNKNYEDLVYNDFDDLLHAEHIKNGISFGTLECNGIIRGINLYQGLALFLYYGAFETSCSFDKIPVEDEEVYQVIVSEVPFDSQTSPLKAIGAQFYSGVFFMNKSSHFNLEIPPFQCTKCVAFKFTREVAETFIQHENDWLSWVLKNPQNPFVAFESLSFEAKLLLNNVIEAKAETPLELSYLRTKAHELLTRLFLETIEKRRGVDLTGVSKVDAELIFKIKEKLVSNLTEAPTIEALSNAYGISKTKLKRLFKHVFGTTIYQFFLDHRMGLARKLLSEGNMSVTEVGYAVGYSNLSHFADSFKTRFGYLPSEITGVH